jgi:hypothetical protein
MPKESDNTDNLEKLWKGREPDCSQDCPIALIRVAGLRYRSLEKAEELKKEGLVKLEEVMSLDNG